jgi:hypothetical protein
MNLVSLRRGIPTIVIAGALLLGSAAGGASAALLITGKQIKDNTVTTKDIRNGTLTTKDMSLTTIAALKGARGPAGATGSTGPTGPAGSSGISGYQLVSNSAAVAAGTGSDGVTATCPAGKRLLSGAASWTDSLDGTQVDLDISTTAATGWGFNSLTTADTLTVEVICATVS